MSSPTPALLTQRAARRLPRPALLLFCAAYVLPGVFSRDPWRNADVTAFGQMAAIADGRSAWLNPTLGGVAGDAALLPHWLGALFIKLLSPLLAADLAARLPFAALLALTLALVWTTTFQLARTEAAQPVAFAFGGEADPVDYARAIADGALLALIACLGLLQLGHETTPELAQLFGIGLFLWALSAAPYRRMPSRLGALAALLVLAGSGAPSIGLVVGVGGGLVCWRSRYQAVRRLVPWLAGGTLAAAALATAIGAWRLRVEAPGAGDWPLIARQWIWFLWPAWPDRYVHLDPAVVRAPEAIVTNRLRRDAQVPGLETGEIPDTLRPQGQLPLLRSLRLHAHVVKAVGDLQFTTPQT